MPKNLSTEIAKLGQLGTMICIWDVDGTMVGSEGVLYRLMLQALSILGKDHIFAIATHRDESPKNLLQELEKHSVEFCPELVLSKKEIYGQWRGRLYGACQPNATNSASNANQPKTVERVAPNHFKFTWRRGNYFLSFTHRYEYATKGSVDSPLFSGKILYIFEILFLLGVVIKPPQSFLDSALISDYNYSDNLTVIPGSTVVYADDDLDCFNAAKSLGINAIFADSHEGMTSLVNAICRQPNIDLQWLPPIFLKLAAEIRQLQTDIKQNPENFNDVSHYILYGNIIDAYPRDSYIKTLLELPKRSAIIAKITVQLALTKGLMWYLNPKLDALTSVNEMDSLQHEAEALFNSTQSDFLETAQVLSKKIATAQKDMLADVSEKSKTYKTWSESYKQLFDRYVENSEVTSFQEVAVLVTAINHLRSCAAIRFWKDPAALLSNGDVTADAAAAANKPADVTVAMSALG